METAFTVAERLPQLWENKKQTIPESGRIKWHSGPDTEYVCWSKDLHVDQINIVQSDITLRNLPDSLKFIIEKLSNLLTNNLEKFSYHILSPKVESDKDNIVLRLQIFAVTSL